MSELGELRASLARAQRELEAAHDRLEVIERQRADPTATVLTPRGHDRQRKKLIAVGALSSIGTAVLLGIFTIMLGGPKAAPPAPVVVTAPPPVVTAPPPVTTVAIPDPPPVVTVAPPVVAMPPEPPRPPSRLARVNASEPGTAPARARPDADATGSLTVVCMPVKCDSIIDNGVALGPGHIFNRPVAAGVHKLTLHAANGETKMVRVDVHADQLKEIRVAMTNPSDVF